MEMLMSGLMKKPAWRAGKCLLHTQWKA